MTVQGSRNNQPGGNSLPISHANARSNVGPAAVASSASQNGVMGPLDPDKPVPDGRVRVDNFDFMSSQPKRDFVWLRIDANNNCNLKCTYCRVPRSTQLIDAGNLEQYLRTKVGSVRKLQFGCGMEPTLDSRLADLMLMASQTPARPTEQFTIQTNGTLLHRHDHDKMRAAGLNRMSISIDSLDPEIHKNQRGGSDVGRIVRNVEEFHKNCPEVQLQFICVVTSANIATVKDLAAYAADLGVTRMAFRQMVYVPNHPLVVEEDILPLIVDNKDFYEMKEEIQGELAGRMEMSFYDTNDLNQHRQKMRKGSYYDQHADKPMQTAAIKVKPGMDILADKKFFVLRGFMKSGTNWIGRLLNLHPEISCAGEFHWQSVTMPFLKNIERSKLMREKEGLRNQMWRRLDNLLKECVVLANHPDAKWVGDRTPAHVQPGILTGSKVFHLIRDGRDVLVSRAYHFFNNPTVFPRFNAMEENRKRIRAFQKDPQFFVKNPGQLLTCNEFVSDSAMYWAKHIRHDLKTIDEKLEPGRSLEIRYEDVHNDTEGQRRRMYEFLECDPNLGAELTFSTSPGFEKEMPNRFLRKGQVGDWRNYMTPEVIRTINEQAGDLLMELGYVDSLNWNVTTPLKTQFHRAA